MTIRLRHPFILIAAVPLSRRDKILAMNIAYKKCPVSVKYHPDDMEANDIPDVNVVMTNDKPDASKEIVVQGGVDLNRFKSRGQLPLLYMHERGNVIGRVKKINPMPDRHEGTIEFDSDGRGWMIGKMFARGYLTDVSIGYITKKRRREGDITYLEEIELVELSVVDIADNPDSFRKALDDGVLSEVEYKSLGLTKEPVSTKVNEKEESMDLKELQAENKELREQNVSLTKVIADIAGKVSPTAAPGEGQGNEPPKDNNAPPADQNQQNNNQGGNNQNNQNNDPPQDPAEAKEKAFRIGQLEALAEDKGIKLDGIKIA